MQKTPGLIPQLVGRLSRATPVLEALRKLKTSGFVKPHGRAIGWYGKRIRQISVAILAIAAPASHAEDIDIFTGGGGQNPSPPNVLVLLDNTSNWSGSAQAWGKTDVSAQCAGDAACLDLVSQVFGDHASLTQGQVELASLKQVLNERVCGTATPIKLNVGLMMLKPTAGA